MKVYSVLSHVNYEGQDLLGVFGSREQALDFARSKLSKHADIGLLESELGQEVDFFSQVEWVE